MYAQEAQPANGTPGQPKPALLCLHGGGTNATIFNVQTIRIQRVLDPHFDFVFLDGPLEGEPGPGVVPVFEGLDPYRRWHVKGEDVKPAQTVAVLHEAMAEQRKRDGRGFVGALGFSQGAKVVAGLLLEQQVLERRRSASASAEEMGMGFAFGVLFNGTTPPLTAGLTSEERGELIGIPSLHVVGTDDPWRGEGVELFGEHFDPRTARLMEFKVGHRLPVLERETAEVASEILRMYAESGGDGRLDLSAVVE